MTSFSVLLAAFAKRHAVIVIGVNQGPSPLLPLRYAHEDARKIQEILLELGNVPQETMRLSSSLILRSFAVFSGAQPRGPSLATNFSLLLRPCR